MERRRVYFASDVHLGLNVKDPEAREARFLTFLRSIPTDSTLALYLLGDIWDFWYEYKDVIPWRGVRVVAALQDLMDAGVEVYFFPGNHDIWCFHYFESIGIKIIREPLKVNIEGKTFCLAHGDGLGPGMLGYKLMNKTFKCRPVQWLFSLLHPWLAYRLGLAWSRRSRLSKGRKYVFNGPGDPLYQWAEQHSDGVDIFIFGHLHCAADMTLPSGARLLVMDDWMEGSPYLYFDGISVFGGSSINMET